MIPCLTVYWVGQQFPPKAPIEYQWWKCVELFYHTYHRYSGGLMNPDRKPVHHTSSWNNFPGSVSVCLINYLITSLWAFVSSCRLTNLAQKKFDQIIRQDFCRTLSSWSCWTVYKILVILNNCTTKHVWLKTPRSSSIRPR